MAQQFQLPPDVMTEALRKGDAFASTKMLEQANTVAVQTLVGALSVGDYETFAAGLHPDVELMIHCPDWFPWIRNARGIEDVTTAASKNFGGTADQVPIVNALTAQGDEVNISTDETGRFVETGQSYSITGIIQFKLVDGKVIEIREIISEKLTSPGA